METGSRLSAGCGYPFCYRMDGNAMMFTAFTAFMYLLIVLYFLKDFRKGLKVCTRQTFRT